MPSSNYRSQRGYRDQELVHGSAQRKTSSQSRSVFSEDSNSILQCPSPRSPSMSPNGALPIILPPDEHAPSSRSVKSPIKFPTIESPGKPSSPFKQQNAYQTSSPNKIHKKVSFSNHTSEFDNTVDMKHNDDEFSFVAHLLLNYLSLSQIDDASVSDGCHGPLQDIFDTIFSAATGESYNKKKQKRRQPRPVYLTDSVLLAFHAALKHRLKFMPFRPSPNDNDVTKLTREVSRALSTHGMPFIHESPNANESKPHEPVKFDEREHLDREQQPQLKQPARQQFFPEEDNDTPDTHQQSWRPDHSAHNSDFFPEHEGASYEYEHEPKPGNCERLCEPPVYYAMDEQTGQMYYHHEGDVFEATNFVTHTSTETPTQTGALLDNDVFEIVEDVESPLSYEEVLAVESEYYVHPDAGSIGGRTPFAMTPDRSFEAETVVVREICEPVRVPAPMTYSANRNDQRMEQVQERKDIHLEIQRVSHMMHMTSNEQVKWDCRERIRKLQFNLKDLYELQNRNEVPVVSSSPTGKIGLGVSRTTESLHELPITYSSPEGKLDLEVPHPLERLTKIKNDNSPQTKDHISKVAPETPSTPEGVKVVAPMDLPADYHFQVQTSDHEFIATVPKGGVKKGEVFQNSIHSDDDGTHFSAKTSHRKGRWNDGILSCLKFGPLHASVLNSIFCPILSLAQVMTRLKIGWLWLPGRAYAVRDIFRMALLMSMFVAVINCLLYYLPQMGVITGNFSFLQFTLFVVVDGLLLAYFLINAARTRRLLRQRYVIPEQSCVGYEDAAITFPCYALVLMQMQRHTADYETYSAQCCSSNGLPLHVRVELPPSPTTSESSNFLSEPLWEPGTGFEF